MPKHVAFLGFDVSLGSWFSTFRSCVTFQKSGIRYLYHREEFKMHIFQEAVFATDYSNILYLLNTPHCFFIGLTLLLYLGYHARHYGCNVPYSRQCSSAASVLNSPVPLARVSSENIDSFKNMSLIAWRRYFVQSKSNIPTALTTQNTP